MNADILIALAALVFTFLGWLTTWADEDKNNKNGHSL